jgi:ABC-type multidrug transport system fused ATPase/permease subunit
MAAGGLYILAALALLSSIRKRTIPLWKEQRSMSADYYGFLSERLAGLEDIRANGAGRAMSASARSMCCFHTPTRSRNRLTRSRMNCKT